MRRMGLPASLPPGLIGLAVVLPTTVSWRNLEHANAKRVSITMNYAGDVVVLRIEDDRSGFDPRTDQIHSSEGGGCGLLGMKERATLVGGNL